MNIATYSSNWPLIRIGDLTEVSTGGTPSTSQPAYYGGSINWLKSGDVKGQYIRHVPQKITELGIANSNARVHPRGTVMLAMSGQGKTRGMVSILDVESACSQSVAAILPNSHTVPEFLYFVLKAQYEQIRRITGDNERTGLNLKIIRNMRIPLPSVFEQDRIAKTLSEEIEAVDRARKAAEEQLAAAKELRSAFLREIFNDDRMRKWSRRKIGELASVQSGYAFKSEWFEPTGIRLLRNANVFQGFISWENTVCLPESRRQDFRNYELMEGDIVLSLDRPVVSAGLKVAQLTAEDLPSLLLQRVGRFSIVSEELSSDYFYLFLKSQIFIEGITGHDQSLGVPHVSPSQVENVTIPLPPLDLQRELSCQLTESIKRSCEVVNELELQLRTIERLPASILAPALRGAL